MWDDDDPVITPKEAREFATYWLPTGMLLGVLAIAALAVLIGIICLIGWLAGGWFQSHSIQRQYSNTVNSQAYQQSLEAELSQHLSNISSTATDRLSVPAGSPEQVNLRAQQLSEIKLFCEQSVNFIPQDVPNGQQLQGAIAGNCSAGAPVVNPPLASPVPQEASQ